MKNISQILALQWKTEQLDTSTHRRTTRKLEGHGRANKTVQTDWAKIWESNETKHTGKPEIWSSVPIGNYCSPRRGYLEAETLGTILKSLTRLGGKEEFRDCEGMGT